MQLCTWEWQLNVFMYVTWPGTEIMLLKIASLAAYDSDTAVVSNCVKLSVCQSIINWSLWFQCMRHCIWSLVGNHQWNCPLTSGTGFSFRVVAYLMVKDMTNNWSQQLRWVNFKWLLFRVQEISSTNFQQFSTLVLTVHKSMQNSFDM
jgi:hypothetical protein